jgi:peptidoglycan L-alanyl-D-glutamate endopeptidase CwlK
MPEFSTHSLSKLGNVHRDLQVLFMEVVKDFDCTIIAGLRTQEEQQKLYAQGRSEPGEIVTFKDGIDRRSKHQDGRAVDAAPYPVDWKDEERFRNFGWYVLGVAKTLKGRGVIENDVKWGGLWAWKDLPHFEI